MSKRKPLNSIALGERSDVAIKKGAATTIIAGMIAPSFALNDQFGNVVHSNKLLARRPLALFFFRALWCDYCVRELAAVEKAADLLRDRGAAVVGVSQYRSSEVSRFGLDTGISFPVLNDELGRVVDAYGLRSVMPVAHIAIHGSDWAPVPARFVIAKNGVVAYGDADPDYTHRPDPTELAPIISRIHTAR